MSAITRMRRLRRTEALREMVRETRVSPANLVLPLFVREGKGERRAVASMPGVAQLSVELLVEEAKAAAQAGVRAALLFGIPARKDAKGSQAYDDEGVVQRATRALKRDVADLCVITDVCLCDYTDHGHCGVIREIARSKDVDNDATVELLARAAVSHARAGADIVAPSDMMDGRVAAIRKALDDAGFEHVAILSYAAKFASSLYGPFREAAESAPAFGDRRSYQMDCANGDEAVREAIQDAKEGADIVMVKPALGYLDVVRRVKDALRMPVAVYNVSGEYAMVKAAAAKGWLDERSVALEMLTGFRRAGADLIVTYWAKEAAQWL